MVFGRIGFVVDRESLAYGDLLGYSIAALVQMEAEEAMALPCHRLAVSDLEQAGLAIAVLVVRPASQLDSDRRIHVALEPVPSCTFDRS
jgi:hypothetical protein